MFRIITGNNNFFTLRIPDVQTNHGYPTRFKERGELTLPFCRTTFSQRSFLYRAMAAWNNVPANIRNITVPYSFKKQIKDLMSITPSVSKPYLSLFIPL
jgi:hypothetical protein